MNILVCVKRVPAPGARMVLTDDERDLNTRHLGFAVSPHEECAVEAAIQLIEEHGGNATVLTLGPMEADEQLRYAMAMGMTDAIMLETDGRDWGPRATARAIVETIQAESDAGHDFDLLLFGNESADSGGYQIGIRVAHALDLPCVNGIKALEIHDSKAVAKREAGGGWEVFEVDLPAVFTVKEGITLPRYPPMRGRLRAKKAEIKRIEPQQIEDGLEKIRLKVPVEQDSEVVILGEGTAAAPKVVEILKEQGMV
ncbi:electron transfer flavoprotein subunit beta/FixA family protein [Chloroflexi bacterium TSY]|nr:electron transfer flavoprotein subunit beta/FixA family protein [Chloroflexi bacterium TSY]